MDLRRAGDVNAAIALYKQLAISQPEHHEAFEGLAECYAQEGKIAEARYFMGEALQRARRFLKSGSLDQERMDDLLALHA